MYYTFKIFISRNKKNILQKLTHIKKSKVNLLISFIAYLLANFKPFLQNLAKFCLKCKTKNWTSKTEFRIRLLNRKNRFFEFSFLPVTNISTQSPARVQLQGGPYREGKRPDFERSGGREGGIS